MPLKAVLVALLVPPTSLLLFALAGLLVERRSRRIGRCMTWFGLLGLLALGMPATGGSLVLALESSLPLAPPPDAPPEAIVILGGDVIRGGSQPLRLHLGPLSLERVRFGALLYRRTQLPILVTGGSLHEGEPPLGAVMADSLVHEFQVPVQWIEPASRDTWENAQFSATILRRQGIKSVYVVTQAWHMRRAVMSFQAAGLTVTAAPPRLDRLPTPLWTDFVPEVGGWRASYYAMHEWIGLAYYSLR